MNTGRYTPVRSWRPADFLHLMGKIGNSWAMATKKRASKSSSSGDGESRPKSTRKRASTSRKTIRKTTAALARRAEDDDDKDKGESGKKASADKGGDAKDTAAPDKDAGKSQPAAAPAKAASQASASDPPARSAAKPAESSSPAIPAAPAEPAPKAEPAASRTAEPAAEPQPSPQPSGAAPDPSMMEPAAEFAELLHPMLIGERDPDAPAHPPGKAPPGDSRSFRRMGDDGQEFVLIYRHYSNLIIRAGTVGKEGTWTVTEYPNGASAANAYAHKCSDFTGAGYRDLR